MSPLPASGGATPEQLVRYVIKVDDQGTPVFRRFAQDSNRALKFVEEQSGQTFTTAGAQAQQAGRKVEELGKQSAYSRQQVQHLQHAFGILGFHLAAAGSQAARATSAFAGLAIHGFSPLSLAIAGLAAGIGVLIMRHGAAEEAAKRHAAAEREVYEASREGQVEVRGLRLEGGAAAARAADLEVRVRQQDVRIADAQRRLDQEVERLKEARIRGLPVGTSNAIVQDIRGMSSQRYVEEYGRFHIGSGEEDLTRELDELWIERGRIYADLSRLQGAALAERTTAEEKRLFDEALERLEKSLRDREKQVEDLRRAFEEYDEGEFERRTSESDRRIDEEVEARARLAGETLRQIELSEEAEKKAREEAEARERLVEAFEAQAAKQRLLTGASTDYARRLLELRLEHQEFLASLGPEATFEQRDRAAAAFRDRVASLNLEFSRDAAERSRERERDRLPSAGAGYEEWRGFLGTPDAAMSGLRRGSGVAAAVIGDLNQELARVVLTSRGDFQRIAEAFQQSLTLAFVSAMTEATIQKPLEALFASFFATLGGTAAAGAGAGADAGFGAPLSQSLALAPGAPRSVEGGPLELSVEVYPPDVVGDEALLKSGRRAREAFVAATMTRSGRRGYRAPP